MLSNPSYRDMIVWLPHGRSWQVLQPKLFEEKVIPLFFRHRNIGSFMRQVNGWGFRRVNHGPDRNSYYHECFLRGFPELCRQMRRPNSEELRELKSGPSIAPNFYEMSKRYPLPEKNSAYNDVVNIIHPGTQMPMRNLEVFQRAGLVPSGVNSYLQQPNPFLNSLCEAGVRPLGAQELLLRSSQLNLLNQSQSLNALSQIQQVLPQPSLLRGRVQDCGPFGAQMDVDQTSAELQQIQRQMKVLQERLSLLNQPVNAILSPSFRNKLVDPRTANSLSSIGNLIDPGIKKF